MGVSTDAVLFYGFELSEDLRKEGLSVDDISFIEHEGWEERFHQAMGKPEEFAFQTAEKHARGCSGDWHCHMDHPIYFLCAWKIEAHRGCSQSVELPKNPRELELNLRWFCKKLGVKYREPEFILASSTDF